jgi:hypothetical protein
VRPPDTAVELAAAGDDLGLTRAYDLELEDLLQSGRDVDVGSAAG